MKTDAFVKFGRLVVGTFHVFVRRLLLYTVFGVQLCCLPIAFYSRRLENRQVSISTLQLAHPRMLARDIENEMMCDWKYFKTLALGLCCCMHHFITMLVLWHFTPCLIEI